MTKKERKYLRAAYHHFRFLENKPSMDSMAKVAIAAPIMHEIVFHVLCMEGEDDGYSEGMLNEIFEQHQIEFL